MGGFFAQFDAITSVRDDPQKYLTIIRGKAFGIGVDKHRAIEVASCEGVLFDHHRWSNDPSAPALDKVFDQLDEYAKLVYTRLGTARSRIASSPRIDALVITHINVPERFRGNRLALFLIEEMRRLYGRSCLTVLRAEGEDSETLSDNRKLARYYAQVPGMRIVSGTRIVCDGLRYFGRILP